MTPVVNTRTSQHNCNYICNCGEIACRFLSIHICLQFEVAHPVKGPLVKYNKFLLQLETTAQSPAVSLAVTRYEMATSPNTPHIPLPVSPHPVFFKPYRPKYSTNMCFAAGELKKTYDLSQTDDTFQTSVLP